MPVHFVYQIQLFGEELQQTARHKLNRLRSRFHGWTTLRVPGTPCARWFQAEWAIRKWM